MTPLNTKTAAEVVTPATFNIQPGQKVLVTTDGWFYAPDGRQYRAVFGTVRGIQTAEATLQVRPNGRSTNWYLEVGRVLLAGCQVHYVVRTDECRDGPASDYTTHPERGILEYERPCSIYFADEPSALQRFEA